MKVEGKVALITGSSRGVGRAIALHLASLGCKVILNYRVSQQEAASALESIRSTGASCQMIQADVSREADCQRLVLETIDAFGQLDILVNNAATTDFLEFGDLEQLSDAHWDRILQTNVKGPFYCTRAAKPWLEQSPQGGEVVHITSIAGLTGNGSSLAYCASKAALINMTISMARILAPSIRVNSVAPGFIDDAWTQSGLGDRYESAKSGHASKSVMGKVCLPEDVAEAVVSIITGSDMVTGQTVVCDGGSMIGPRA